MPTLDRPRIDYRTPADLVTEVNRGLLRIPPFQRGFKWESSDAIALFDSLLRGFPIGNLLFWRRPAPAATVRVGPLEIEAPALDSANWVVDGQQRVTTLVGALAAAEDTADPRFRIYLDLDDSTFHSLGARQQAPQTWLPVSRLLETPVLLAWMRENAGWMTDEHLKLADEAAKAIREYQIPTYVVTSEDEGALRKIFDRLNNTGKPLSRAEVFHALNSGLAADEPNDLKALGAIPAQLGFGSFDERLALRCVLAFRGGDMYREDFHDEFASDEERQETFKEVSACIREVVAFLRGEAGIAHSRLLPFNYVVPVLTRFVRLHGQPTGRVAQLLRRWVWRGAVAGVASRGVSGSGARQAVNAVDARDPYQAAQQLLSLVPHSSSFRPDLEKVHLNSATAKINMLGLLSVGPRDLATGQPLDPSAVFDAASPVREIINDRAVALAQTFANRLIIGTGPVRSVESLLRTSTPKVAASHLLDETCRGFLIDGNAEAFLWHRGALVGQIVSDHVDTMAEWGARDGRSIADIMRSVA
jgi:hypothetical protein